MSWSSLTAVFLFLCGWGCSGGGGATSVIPPSALTYTTGTAIYTKGVPITANTPASSGGAATSYSVTPALPSGLSLSAGTGVISGTPTSVAPTASYNRDGFQLGRQHDCDPGHHGE